MIEININGEWQQVSQIDPNMTVLGYLRTIEGRNQVKEGCASGDCGACTVLMVDENAKTSDGRLALQPINSCITLLASLHKRAIYTLSSLSSQSDLHPAQKTMIECHGSQCGFCTPGFIHSMAAMHHNHESSVVFSEEEVAEELAGNLCRCTGYRPIIEAAVKMQQHQVPKDALISELDAGVQLFDPQQPQNESVAHLNQRVFIPETLEALNHLLQQHPDATLWAGGTDLGLELTQAYKQFDHIICLHRVDELSEIKQNEHTIELGAMVTYNQAQALFESEFPSMAQLNKRIAATQIRNLGTLGGNIANASPIGDTPPVFLALQAKLQVDGINGPKTIAIDDFFKGYKQTALEQSEYIASIEVPKLEKDDHFITFKVSKRKDDDISAVLMAAKITTKGDEIETARVAFGGMDAIPRRCLEVEHALRGQAFTMSAFEKASKKVSDSFTPMSDVRATAQYRLDVAANLIIKMGLELTGAAL